MNTHVAVSDIHMAVSNIRSDVSKIREGIDGRVSQVSETTARPRHQDADNCEVST